MRNINPQLTGGKEMNKENATKDNIKQFTDQCFDSLIGNQRKLPGSSRGYLMHVHPEYQIYPMQWMVIQMLTTRLFSVS